jgi:hypothetical protein
MASGPAAAISESIGIPSHLSLPPFDARRQHYQAYRTLDRHTGHFNVGGGIEFRFGTRGRIDMKVIELDPARHVVWQVAGGPGEWIGSKVSFELKPDGDYAVVLFRHQGWKEPSELMH